MHRLYLTRQPPHLVQLPTSTFVDAPGSVFDHSHSNSDVHDLSEKYTPGEMSDAEILYGSSGRSSIPSGSLRGREVVV